LNKEKNDSRRSKKELSELPRSSPIWGWGSGVYKVGGKKKRLEWKLSKETIKRTTTFSQHRALRKRTRSRKMVFGRRYAKEGAGKETSEELTNEEGDE